MASTAGIACSATNQVGRLIGKGAGDARPDTLQQNAGRLYRAHPGKTEVRIHNYADRREVTFPGTGEHSWF